MRSVPSKERAAALLIAVLTIGSIAPTGARASSPRPVVSADAIDRIVNDWVRANGVPGLSLAITRRTGVIHLKGYGDAGDGPVTPDTQFLVASLSKSFTALAVLQLVEAGQVDLDEPIRTYLPRFTVADPSAAGRITVRMLLNQTSGMADAGFPAMTLPQPSTTAARVASLGEARLVDEPGAAFHYHNPNYEVLARLVEVVGGEPFSEYLRAHVFDRLGMTETRNIVTLADAASVAPHLAQGHILAFSRPIAWDESDGYLAGSGGVISTARDMATWLILQNGGGVFRGHSLLSSRGIQLMHTPVEGIDGSYAMGWIRRSGTPAVLEHTGVLSTFYAEQALLPDERVGIVFLANAYHGLIDFAGLMDRLIALITGERDPGRGLGVRRIGFVFGALTALIAAFGLSRIGRVRSWTDKRRGRPWRAAVGVAVPFVPTVLTALTPSLIARLSDRVFGWRAILLATPDVMGCLILAGAIGAALGIARIVSLSRRRGTRWVR
jgi:CubicO group peptidase (beta-lactamase class C family)